MRCTKVRAAMLVVAAVAAMACDDGQHLPPNTSVDSVGVVHATAPGVTTNTATARGDMNVKASAIVTVRLS
jgi:hypothetical protein